MNKPVKLLWVVGGTAMILVGAAELGGRPALLLALGTWAVLGTMFDILLERLKP